ncbi:MAG: hypothetical protein A3G81_05035 [Betaproteobacteria bacterium RIFCSPLOWO2_12_FULL_65_14]|nr:MAG: hypothetical protein A3G81_05035 [Betaproteobacteria bacterium RIFCSPLOWO2_12_FULL_65_14]
MPEQLTKHPDVTLEVLKSAGAKCGAGLPQNILKQCPAERFCALPGGEMCVYGLADIGKMTQISAAELAAALRPVPAETSPPEVSWAEGLAVVLVFVAGLLIGALWRRSRRSP